MSQGSTCPSGYQGSAHLRTRSTTGHQGSVDECDEGAAPPPAPTPVTTDLWLWNRADSLVTKDGLNFCSAWGDLSGNNHGSTQAVISGPLWIANGINGLPSIAFDGANGLQNLVDNIPLGQRTLMIVARPDGPIGGTLFSFRRSVKDWAAYSWLFAGTQYVWSDGVTNIAAAAAVDYSGAPHLYVHEQSGGNTLIARVDLTTIVTVPPAITTDEDGSNGYTVGGRGVALLQGFDGMISDVLIYTRVLTAPEYAQNLAYVAARYGVAV